MMRSLLLSPLFLIGLSACSVAEPPPVPAGRGLEKAPTAATPQTNGATVPVGSPTKPASQDTSLPGSTVPPVPTSTPTGDTKPGTPTPTGTPTDTTTGGTPQPTPQPTPNPPTSPTPPQQTARAFWSSASDGDSPAGAVSAGSYDGERSLICRVKLSSGAVAPGTLLPSQGVCFYVVGAEGFYAAQYDVLAVSGDSASALLEFVAAADGAYPAMSVKGGQEATRELAICAVSTSFGVAYGQVGSGDPGCVYYGLNADGEAVAVYRTSYWVLVSKK